MKNYYRRNKDFIPDSIYFGEVEKVRKREKNLIIFIILLNILLLPFTVKKAYSQIFLYNKNTELKNVQNIMQSKYIKTDEIKRIYDLLKYRNFNKFNIKNGKGTVISEDLNKEKSYFNSSDFKILKIKEKIDGEKKIFEIGIDINDKKIN
ncbi:hypothetical protein [Clostridium sp. BJN0001]|uniref:hypothetical protein n=1 Tax=Clostridium sp. BJN0001 TaxID=2930219 RepID=UPI001FD12F27|nr:hypothetical protein [Clostridium sp. BJN0001]